MLAKTDLFSASLAPELSMTLNVASGNGYKGTVTADAFGVIACLYAYSHFSFYEPSEFSKKFALHYHLLLDYAFEHLEAKCILKCVD